MEPATDDIRGSATDIIFVAPAEHSDEFVTTLQNILTRINSGSGDIQVGGILYHSAGGIVFSDGLDANSAQDSYMIDLSNVDSTEPGHKFWNDVNWQRSQSLPNSVSDATRFPFRINSHKMVILLCGRDDSTTSLTSIDTIVNSFKRKSVTFDAFTLYDVLKPSKVLGFNYDGSMISRNNRGKSINLPKYDLVELVKQTKGAVYDLKPLIENRAQRINHIVRHLKAQIQEQSSC